MPSAEPLTAPAATTSDRPAYSALRRIFDLFAIILRTTCAVAATVTAIVVAAPPVRPEVVIVVTGALTAWAALFGWLVWRRGLLAPLVAADLAATLAVCLCMRYLVPAGVLPGGVSWVAVLSSTSMVIALLAWPPVASVPAGLATAAAYFAGARAAGVPDEAIAHAITLLVQTAATAGLVALVTRAGRAADAALVEYHTSQTHAAVAEARRAAERRQNRGLHDFALATLTMVGFGAVSDAGMLRERARVDLAELERLDEPAGPQPGYPGGGERGRLDRRLAALPARVPQLRVRLELAECDVPPAVADAVADSAAQALANVVRHAGVDRAVVRLRAAPDDDVLVEIEDAGIGFDPATVPAHRYGLRGSIHERMATVGGRAEIASAPGAGTRVRLEWRDGR
jgi:signal transduction histidine kinase